MSNRLDSFRNVHKDLSLFLLKVLLERVDRLEHRSNLRDNNLLNNVHKSKLKAKMHLQHRQTKVKVQRENSFLDNNQFEDCAKQKHEEFVEVDESK